MPFRDSKRPQEPTLGPKPSEDRDGTALETDSNTSSKIKLN